MYPALSPAIEPEGRPVCCLKRSYSWLGFAGVCRSSSMLVLVGLAMVDVALDSLFSAGWVGDSIWAKSKNSFESTHWFGWGLKGAMVIAGWIAVAMLVSERVGKSLIVFGQSLGRQVDVSRCCVAAKSNGDQERLACWRVVVSSLLDPVLPEVWLSRSIRAFGQVS